MNRLANFFLHIWSIVRAAFAPDDMTEIDTGVYQGGTPDRLPSMLHAVLNLQAEHTDRPEFVPGFGCLRTYCWMGIPDTKFPGIQWLDAAVDTIVAWRKQDWTVLIHCLEGRSRSGMVDIAFHMKTNGWSAAAAYAYVRGKRPQTCPNPAFMEGLLRYEYFLATGT